MTLDRAVNHRVSFRGAQVVRDLCKGTDMATNKGGAAAKKTPAKTAAKTTAKAASVEPTGDSISAQIDALPRNTERQQKVYRDFCDRFNSGERGQDFADEVAKETAT